MPGEACCVAHEGQLESGRCETFAECHNANNGACWQALLGHGGKQYYGCVSSNSGDWSLFLRDLPSLTLMRGEPTLALEFCERGAQSDPADLEFVAQGDFAG